MEVVRNRLHCKEPFARSRKDLYVFFWWTIWKKDDTIKEAVSDS